MKQLAQWCSNNWRMAHGSLKPQKMTIRRIDVVWKTHREDVEEEVARLKTEEGRTSTDFVLRTEASKTVIENMDAEDKAILEEAYNRISKEGYSEEHKRE